MSAHERTVQITLPADVYERIELEAVQSERSVEAVLVEAVARQFQSPADVEVAALQDLPDDELWERLNNALSPDDQDQVELIYTHQERSLNEDELRQLDDLQRRLVEQNAPAAAIIAILRQHAVLDLEEELRWQASFAKSQHILEKMADEALAEHRAGRTEPLDPDTL